MKPVKVRNAILEQLSAQEWITQSHVTAVLMSDAEARFAAAATDDRLFRMINRQFNKLLVDGKIVKLSPLAADGLKRFRLSTPMVHIESMDVQQFAAHLATKLTSDEMYQLFDLVDSDPPGGDFWEALGDQAKKARPDKFGSLTNEKEEIEVHPDELDETSFETLGHVV